MPTRYLGHRDLRPRGLPAVGQCVFQRFLLWPLLLISHFLAAALLAWHLLAQGSFGFALAYPALNINEHIEHFGPQNRYKSGFGDTDKAEHLRLFGEIADSIQKDGEGLASITYTGPEGEPTLLMRPPEVLHLQDVAHLVTFFYQTGLIAAVLLVLLSAYTLWRRPRPPRVRSVLLVLAITLAAGAILLWSLGPKTVFYRLHEWVFPPDHPWFFYYQDSLMTTLMKAPDLFGFIGALLLALTLVIWGGTLIPFWRWLNDRARL